jgi:signal peptidase I
MSETTRSSRRRARERGVWSYLAAGLGAGLMILVIGVAALVIVVPGVTGSVALTVLTPSMEPSLPPGTLVVVRPTSVDDIRIGDVATYQLQSGQPELVTHRVIGISHSTGGTTTLTTQGDANGEPDAAPVTPEQIKGVVWYSLPWIGYANNAIGGGGQSWLVVGIAVVLFAYAGWMFIGGMRRPKRRRESATP